MYTGRIVETGHTAVLERPPHPYTLGLLDAIVDLELPDRPGGGDSGEPSRSRPDAGRMRLHPRCSFARADCRLAAPSLRAVGRLDPGHVSACFHLETVLGSS